MELQKIEKEALTLSPEDRAALAHRLLLSLGNSSDESTLETELLSEEALLAHWSGTEEDEAWAHLQPGP